MRRVLQTIALLSLSFSLHAATAYRMTVTTRDAFKQPPSIQRVVVDGNNRRLAIENAEPPYAYDVLLSTDGGKTVTALNTPLRTWFDALAENKSDARFLPRSSAARLQIDEPWLSVVEEPADAEIEGLPVRKFVLRATYTTREDFGSTTVKRMHSITTLLWTTDKLDRSTAFHMPPLDTGVERLDAELREKSAQFGFPLKRVTSVSRAYEGGAPVVETLTVQVDQIHTVDSPPAGTFARPAAYVHQAPVIGGFGKK